MSAGRVLVYGGRGALGSVLVNHFKTKNFWVASVDLVANDQADCNLLVPTSVSGWAEQESAITGAVRGAVPASDGGKLDAIYCVAGGWAGGNAAAADMVANADRMWQQSVWSSAIAARLAALFLRDGGLLVLTGAQPALGGTPGMLGYGMAKAAVHQLVKSLAAPKSGLPDRASALAILPVTLDTPMNRKFMPSADHSAWTPLEFVGGLLADWLADVGKRPASGSLVQLVTKGGETELVLAAA